MTRTPLHSPELGGADPLDDELGLPAFPLLERLGLGRLGPLLQRRAALGLRPSIAPAVILVPAGFLLGPHVAGILTSELLAHLHVGVSLGLALLGIFVGRALARQLRDIRLIAAGTIESGASVIVVAFALWFLITRSHVPVGAGAVIVALCLAITAAASAAHSPDPRGDNATRLASRVADFDDLLLIAAGAVLLVFIRGTYGPVHSVLLIAPIAIGVAVAVAGLLLIERTHDEAERGLLLLGAVALLGGASAYLMTSSLAAGLVAGTVWTLAPGRTSEVLAQDAARMQHPLVALVLLTAGASFVPHQAALWLLAPYVLFRLVGKLVGAAFAAPLLRPATRTFDLANFLVPPGVIGVGFALTFMAALPSEAGEVVISVAAAGTVASELIAMFLIPPAQSEADAA